MQKTIYYDILKFNFFLSLLEREKGNLIFPRNIEEISEINAEVVADAQLPHLVLHFAQLGCQLLLHLKHHQYLQHKSLF